MNFKLFLSLSLLFKISIQGHMTFTSFMYLDVIIQYSYLFLLVCTELYFFTHDHVVTSCPKQAYICSFLKAFVRKIKISVYVGYLYYRFVEMCWASTCFSSNIFNSVFGKIIFSTEACSGVHIAMDFFCILLDC